ncbi:hypothetical protein OY671_011346, partial [Metschnikowia pulcherrima]
SPDVEQARFNMIEQQIRPWDVSDTSVSASSSAVRREDFIPAEHRAQAFMDSEIPSGQGRASSAPRVEARMVQDSNLSKRDTVSLIGATTGYVTASSAHKAQRVIGSEPDAGSAAQARTNMRNASVNNAEIVQADGTAGFPGQAPYDAILSTGSVASVPQNSSD